MDTAPESKTLKSNAYGLPLYLELHRRHEHLVYTHIRICVCVSVSVYLCLCVGARLSRSIFLLLSYAPSFWSLIRSCLCALCAAVSCTGPFWVSSPSNGPTNNIVPHVPLFCLFFVSVVCAYVLRCTISNCRKRRRILRVSSFPKIR